jgi:hypothetical protein
MRTQAKTLGFFSLGLVIVFWRIKGMAKEATSIIPRYTSERAFCPCCAGQIIRKFSDRDPIEGYKLAPQYHCPLCEGKDSFESSHFLYGPSVAFWKTLKEEASERQKALHEKRQKEKELRQSALSKLTDEEKTALNIQHLTP